MSILHHETVAPLPSAERPGAYDAYGLTKRELFAAHIASGQTRPLGGGESLDVWARQVWRLTDALMRNA